MRKYIDYIRMYTDKTEKSRTKKFIERENERERQRKKNAKEQKTQIVL